MKRLVLLMVILLATAGCVKNKNTAINVPVNYENIHVSDTADYYLQEFDISMIDEKSAMGYEIIVDRNIVLRDHVFDATNQHDSEEKIILEFADRGKYENRFKSPVISDLEINYTLQLSEAGKYNVQLYPIFGVVTTVDTTIKIPLGVHVEVNEQVIEAPYELYILNPQTTHYKNGVLFVKVAPDNPGNKRAFSKMFMVDSVLSLQIHREDEWQTVCEYPLKNVDREIKDRQFIEFAVKTKDLEYSENGTYRVEIKVIEPEKEYTLVSDVFDLSVHDLSGDPYDVNDFLSLYPFNLYNVDGVFNQSKRDDLLVGTNYTGCAVPVEQEVYHQLAAMSCKVLSKETCAMNSYQYYLPEDDEVVVIRKVLKEGYIDDRYENHLKELTGAEFSEWLENAINTEPILIPSCLSSHEEMEGFVFTVYRDNEEVEYYLQVSEENNGTFLKIQFYDREKIIGVSYQFYPQIIGY